MMSLPRAANPAEPLAPTATTGRASPARTSPQGMSVLVLSLEIVEFHRRCPGKEGVAGPREHDPQSLLTRNSRSPQEASRRQC